MSNNIFARSAKLLELDGIILLSMEIDNEIVYASILDRYYLDVSQMIGRATRILSKTVPINVKFFNINVVDYQSGFSISKVTVERESLRKFELMFDGPKKLWKDIKIDNSSGEINTNLVLSRSPITWSFYPDVDIMLFDPHSPINGSLGWEANLAYRIRNSTTINSSVKQPILTALNDIKRGPKSGLPNVRSDFMFYYRDISTKPYIDSLTIDQYYKPLKNIYGQINFGYLEMMYAGIRAEAIWKNVKKPYGIGLDLASIRKRNTRGDFSILNESYSTIIGTVYYDLESDWKVQLDAGKYLAGDHGATFSLSRTFNNGWEIGAYATLTDVKFSTFGEGFFRQGDHFESTFILVYREKVAGL
ncbi:MAG: YjbH domain-containing protein [Paracoccaceae bacterium]